MARAHSDDLTSELLFLLGRIDAIVDKVKRARARRSFTKLCGLLGISAEVQG
jgi:hypothetical protein